MLKLVVIIHLEDAHEGKTLSDELRDLTQIEFRSFQDQILDLFIHDLLCEGLLEANGLDHALEIRDIWQLLFHLLHFVVQFFNHVEVERADVLIYHEGDVVVDRLELRIILLFIKCFLDQLELL